MQNQPQHSGSRFSSQIAFGLILLLAASAFATDGKHSRRGEKRTVSVHDERQTTTVVIRQEKRRPTQVVRVTYDAPRVEYRTEDWRDSHFRLGRERGFRSAANHCGKYTDNGRQVTYELNEYGTREHYFRDDRMISYDIQGPDGQYHYFENDEMVSIDDNRFGQKRHVYYRK